MKIGVTMDLNHCYNVWGDDCYKKLKEFGVSCTDFQSMVGDNSFVYTKSSKEAEAILLKDRKLAEEAGIEISQVHGPWRMPIDDGAEARVERLETMKKSIWGAAVLGSKNWVIHALMPYGLEDLEVPAHAEETLEINYEFMGKLLEEAKKYDITICLENLPFPKFSLSAAEDILKFVNTMNDDHFKICFDTGHSEVYRGANVAEDIRAVGSKIHTFHIHDSKRAKDLHLLPYAGHIDWDDFAKSLGDINYKGVFSLETLPSFKMPKEIYEEMFVSLIKIAKSIISKI